MINKTNLIIAFIAFVLSGIAKEVSAQTFVPDHGEDGKMIIKPAVDINAYAFDLKDIRLLNSPFKTAMEAGINYLLELEPDRFLAHFRTHAGLKPKDSVYGGWESSGLAGHSLGHYLSACSLAYAATGNKEFLKRVNYIVDQLALCQQKRGTGYIGAIPNEDSIFGEVAKGHIHTGGFDLNGGWSPWYTVHKIMAGLLDAYIHCDNKKALQVEKGMADWTGNIIKNLDHQQMQKMLICEYGGMNEVLANTYALTGNKKYLKLAYRFYDNRILDSLAMGYDILPGKHANTQIPKVVGCVRIYELTADKHFDSISKFFWNTVVNHYTYAPGGVGNYEYFHLPDHFPLSDNTMETCPTYNLLKLTSHLFTLHPSAHLMDYYERALYNHILATQNHETGMTVYFTPLRMGGRKHYSTPFNTFTCCVGTSMENQVKYGKDIYYHGKDGSLYVNLFIPSVLNWNEKGITIRQETHLPENDIVQLTINVKNPVTFPIRIRKPSWTYKGMVIKVNGKEQKASVDQNGYVTINKTWNDGDHIEAILPMQIHKKAMPDDTNRVAIFYGPELLSGVLGNKEPDPVNGIPVFVTRDLKAKNWIKRTSDDSLIFHSEQAGKPQNVKLIPFNQAKKQYYTVYWDKFTPGQWAIRQKQYEEEKKKFEELKSRTVDFLRVGEMQPERDHHFKGEKLHTGESHTKKWRAAGQGGYFSFTMKVDPRKTNQLICTYWGMDDRGRKFNILINEVKIATVDLNQFKSSKFYHIPYDIPGKLIKNKQQVTVTFRAVKNNRVGPVYGIRMVKK